MANNINGPKLSKSVKDIILLFKCEVLAIIINTNLIDTDFRDVTFTLTTGKYLPYNKPNNISL